jgi:hypothetical protein
MPELNIRKPGVPQRSSAEIMREMQEETNVAKLRRLNEELDAALFREETEKHLARMSRVE